MRDTEQKPEPQEQEPPADLSILLVWFVEFVGGPWFLPLVLVCAVIALAMSC